MKNKVKALLANKDKTVPILSFPSVQLLGISVNELISSSQTQAEAMAAICKRCAVGASLNMMDLSVEAEAFGAGIRFFEDEIPTVESGCIDDISDAVNIAVPKVGDARTGIYIDGVKQAKELITDRPVFCGIIGPYSLAGRLFDMSELMMECYESPEDVKILLSKTTEFLISYVKAFKAVGADGVIMAEPAAGLLSPALAEEFSMPYVKKIFDEIADDDFIICYHNCGNSVQDMFDLVAELGADIVHLGNAVDMKKAFENLPSDMVVMGNIDPVLFKSATPEEIRAEVCRVYNEYSRYENFMISSGCDIPAESKWENIDAYFEMVKELYA
ncbi:MAG: methyltransferase [Ruminococcaceae bacterium]|nr:methyltransferase [Oscillospiraceae bacterium]